MEKLELSQFSVWHKHGTDSFLERRMDHWLSGMVETQ